MLRKILRGLVIASLLLATTATATVYRFEDVVRDRRGNAISGASVYVYEANTTTLATLYRDATETTTRTQPISTDSMGRFWLYAPAGEYDITVSRTGIETYTQEDVVVTGPDVDFSGVVNDSLLVRSSVTGEAKVMLNSGGESWTQQVDGNDQFRLTQEDVDQLVSDGTSMEFKVPTRSAVHDLATSASAISASSSNFIRIARSTKRIFDTINGGTTGQEIRVLLADTMSVLRETTGGNIVLADAGDFQRSGGVISLINYAGTWYEVSRSTAVAVSEDDPVTPPPPDDDILAPSFVSTFASWADVDNEVIFTVVTETDEAAKVQAYAYNNTSAASDTTSLSAAFAHNQRVFISTGDAPVDGTIYDVYAQAVDTVGNVDAFELVGSYTVTVAAAGDPAITGVYGNTSEGILIEVRGTNFGAEPTVISWDDFEAGTLNADLGAPPIGPTWTFHTNPNNPTPYYTDTGSYSGDTSARVAWKEEGWTGYTINAFGWTGQGPLNTLFVSYMRYQDSSITIGEGPYNVKQAIFFGPIDHESCTDGQYVKIDEHQWVPANAGSASNATYWFSYQQTCPTAGIPYWTPRPSYTDSEEIWQRWDFWLDYEDNVADDDTDFQLWYDYDLVLDWTGNGANYDGTQYVNDVRIGFQFQDLGSYTHAWCLYDDVYIADSRARVEVGDNINFASCSKRDIIPTTHWSGTSILAEFRAPSFSDGETAYIFVIDEDGTPSAGEEITITAAGDLPPVGVAEFELADEGSTLAIITTCPGGTDIPADVTMQWRLAGRTPEEAWAPEDSSYHYTGTVFDYPTIGIFPGQVNGEVIYLPSALDSVEARVAYKSAAGVVSDWQVSDPLVFGSPAGDTGPPEITNSFGDIDCVGGNIEINLHIQSDEPATLAFRYQVGAGTGYVDGTEFTDTYELWSHISEATAVACVEGDTVFTRIILSDETGNDTGYLTGPTLYVPGTETTPSIVTVTAPTFSDGDEFVVTATDIGTKGIAGPVLYDDIASTYTGTPTPVAEDNIVPTHDPGGQHGAEYWAAAPWMNNPTVLGETGNNKVYFGTDALYTRRDDLPYYKVTPKGGFQREWPGINTLYVNWWYYYNFWEYYPDQATHPNSTKAIRVWNDTSQSSRRLGSLSWTYQGGGFTEDVNHDCDWDCYTETGNNLCASGGGVSSRGRERVWDNLVIEVDSRNADCGHGDYWNYVNNVSRAYVDRLMASEDMDLIKLIGSDPNWRYGASDPYGTAEIYFGEIYVDSTFARVEVGNAAVYEECDHLQIQVCSTWESGVITFDFEQGSYSAGDTCYVFVTTRDRQHSAGYQFVIGEAGGVTDTTAPTATIVTSTPVVDTTVKYTWGLTLNETGQAFAQWKEATSSTWAPDSTGGSWTTIAEPGIEMGGTLLTGFTPADPDTIDFRILVRDVASNAAVGHTDEIIHNTGAPTYHNENWLFSNNSTISTIPFESYGHDIDSNYEFMVAPHDSLSPYSGGITYATSLRAGDNLPMEVGETELGWVLYFDIADSLDGKTIVDADLHLHTYNLSQDLTAIGEALQVAVITDANFAAWTKGAWTANYAYRDTLTTTAWTTHWSQVDVPTDLGLTVYDQQVYGTYTAYSIDVTSLVQAVADAPTNYGGFFINVRNFDGTGRMSFYTHEKSTTQHRPALSVVTQEPD